MAYRRRQGQGLGRDWKTTSFQKDNNNNNETSSSSSSSSSLTSPTSPSLVTKAIRASSSYKDSSLSSAYYPSLSSPISPSPVSPTVIKDSPTYQTSSSKQGFWGVLARKAKGIIDDNDGTGGIKSPRAPLSESTTPRAQYHQTTEAQTRRKNDNPSIQKGLDAITSSLNYLGGTIGNAFEEGLTMVENRTADIIQETRKIQIKKKDRNFDVQNQNSNIYGPRKPLPVQTHTQPQTHAELEIQLKASRDVAMAMAAKAKLLLRELKTVKADLAFAKERCGQLEEENRVIRESSAEGGSPEDDDLIRLQLETLLAEKARLAQENSVFARENRFLREIVEYHQLTMQDVVYLDENNEEVTEVYPIKVSPALNVQSSSTTATSLPSPTPPPAAQPTTSPPASRGVSPFHVPP